MNYLHLLEEPKIAIVVRDHTGKKVFRVDAAGNVWIYDTNEDTSPSDGAGMLKGFKRS